MLLLERLCVKCKVLEITIHIILTNGPQAKTTLDFNLFYLAGALILQWHRHS